ncbi:hypothetical protein [Sphingobacterium sp.]|uniref:hypothetical protein n=1 Tax=Sphingobacterium sp. TaxID=341027 RepID=UPI0028AF1E0B|nr:hypothetical protein [Sphingobacterium sp.]
MNKPFIISLGILLCSTIFSCKGQNNSSTVEVNEEETETYRESITIGENTFEYEVIQDKTKAELDVMSDEKKFPEKVNFYKFANEADSLPQSFDVPLDRESGNYSSTIIKPWEIMFPAIENNLDYKSFPNSYSKGLLISHYQDGVSPGSYLDYYLIDSDGEWLTFSKILNASPQCLVLLSDDTQSILHFELLWDIENDGGRYEPHKYKVYKYDFVNESKSFNKTFLGTTVNKYGGETAVASRMFFDMVKNEDFLSKVPYGTYLSNNF